MHEQEYRMLFFNVVKSKQQTVKEHSPFNFYCITHTVYRQSTDGVQCASAIWTVS